MIDLRNVIANVRSAEDTLSTPEEVVESAEPEASSASSGYVYGVEGLAASGAALSPSDILVWLEQHSSGVNDQLRERMLDADTRSKLIKDLNHLKADAEKGDCNDLEAEAARLLEAYDGTPFEGEAKQALRYVLENSDHILDKAEAEKVNRQIDAVVDQLGKDDQMDMIFIQELTNRINEQFGFASNFIAKSNETTMAIVANV